jgi:hypothetical protein
LFKLSGFARAQWAVFKLTYFSSSSLPVLAFIVRRSKNMFRETETFLASSAGLSKIGLEGFGTSFALAHE